MMTGLRVELADQLGVVVGDLADGLPGEHVGMLQRFGHGGRIVGPAGGQGGIAPLLEPRPPGVPAAGQQPEPVNEHHRSVAGRVRRRSTSLCSRSVDVMGTPLAGQPGSARRGTENDHGRTIPDHPSEVSGPMSSGVRPGQSVS